MHEALPPNLSHIHAAVIAAWPEHGAVLQKSVAAFPPDQLLRLDDIADQVLRLVDGDMARYIEGYRWISRMQLEEELHFRRTGGYRNSTFEQAWEQVYSKPEVMGLYMDGLLVSQVLWSNHAQTLLSFTEDFLPRLRPGARVLEVGPGHGLGCALAASHSGN
ncbi:MAG TPA: class I SAM-dependent methyltransferase, partial [Deltaproteobacteria bacterium]|nr:class I SAM-dependent methyltransferase [Deltaproteobacteria bacterium]